MQHTPGLYSVTSGASTPASIPPALQRHHFEAWVATLDPLSLSTECLGDPIDIRLGGLRYRFVLHAEAGTPKVEEADPCTYVCTFPDGSRMQWFNRIVEPAQLPFTPPSSGQCFRLEILSVPMSVTLDQHATLPRYVAFLKGFLDERQHVEVYIQTGSSVHREQLVASIATLSLVSDEPALEGG